MPLINSNQKKTAAGVPTPVPTKTGTAPTSSATPTPVAAKSGLINSNQKTAAAKPVAAAPAPAATVSARPIPSGKPSPTFTTPKATKRPEFTESDDAPKNFIDKIKLYAKAGIKDPANTAEAILTKERLRKVTGNAAVFERQKNANQGEGNGKAVDHVIPLSLGGSNNKNNLQTLSQEEKSKKDKIEQYLYRQLAAGEISKKEAQQQIQDWSSKNAPGNRKPVGTISENIGRGATIVKGVTTKKGKEIGENLKELPRGLATAVGQPFMTGEQINKFNPRAKEEDYAKRVSGTFFDVATLGAGGAEVKGAVKTAQAGFKFGAKQVAKTAGVRAIEGGAAGGARAASQGEDLATVAKTAGAGALFGGALGAAEKPVAKLVTNIFRKAPKDVPTGTLTPSTTNLESAVTEATTITRANNVAEFIDRTPNLQIKELKTLGKSTNNKTIQARFEPDAKAGGGVIYVTPKTKPEDLAHEIGHYFHRQLPVEQRVALEAEASLIAGGKGSPNEVFSHAVSNIITGKADRSKAPSLVAMVDQVIKLPEPIATKAEFAVPEEPARFLKQRVDAKNNYKTIGMTSTAGKQPENAGLRIIESQFKTPQGQKAAAAELEGQIAKGAITPNDDGTITVYRGGKTVDQNDLISVSTSREAAAEFGGVTELKVRPEQVAVAKGLDPDELLVTKTMSDPTEFPEGYLEPSPKSDEPTPDELAEVLNPSGERLSEGLENVVGEKGMHYIDAVEKRALIEGTVGATNINNIKRILRSKAFTSGNKDVANIPYFDTDVAQPLRDALGKPDLSTSEALDLIDSLPSNSDLEALRPPTLTSYKPSKARGQEIITKEVIRNRSSNIADPGVTKTGGAPLKSPSYNPSKINADEDLMGLIEQTTLSDKAKIAAQRRGKISNEQLKEDAFKVGLTVDELKQVKAGSIGNQETVFKARQMQADMARELSEFSRSVKGRATKENLIELKKRLSDYMAVQRVVAGFRTESGRLLQSFNVEVRPGENQALNDLVDQLAGIDGGLADEFGLVKNIDKITEPTTIDNIKSLYKAGLIGNPITMTKQILQNTAQAFGENTVRGVAAGIDTLASLTRGTPRSITTPRIKAFFGGGLEGIKEIPEILFKGGGQSQKFEEYKTIKFKNKLVDNTIGAVNRTIFNLMSAGDRPFYLAAFRESIENQARVVGMNEKLRGPILEARIKSLITNPVDEMVAIASHDAEYATLQMPNFFSSAASALKQKAKGNAFGELAIEAVIPLTKTPGGAAKALFDYSPLGFVAQLGRNISKTSSQREFSLAMARPVIGTSIMSLGYILAQNGLVTGNVPKDAKERKLWEIEGKKARSVNINGEWKSLDTISTAGSLLALGAEYLARAKRGEATLSFASLLAIGDVVTDQPFLTGASSALKASQDPKEADKFGANLIANLVPLPSLAGQSARAGDIKRDTSDDLFGPTKAKIPGLSQTLPPRRNIFGETMTNEPRGLAQFYDIFRSSPQKNTPLTKELDRLAEKKALPTLTDVSQSSQRVGEMKAKLPKERYQELLEKFGREYKQGLEQEVEKPHYKKVTDEEKKKLLEDVKADTLDKVLLQFGYSKVKN